MLELSIPFLASVIITILLRRLDKSNINLRKLKTLIERGQKELVDIALQKKEELKDAGTQMDLLLINSEKYLSELKTELNQLKDSVSEVQGSRKSLLEMDGELQSLELTTNSVKDQVRYINESLDKIDQHQKKIKNLQDYIKTVDQDATKMVKSFQKTIGEKSEEVVRLMEQKLSSVSSETHEYQRKLRDELLEKHGLLSQKITESYKDLENSLRSSAKGLTATIEKEVQSRFSIIDELDVRIHENEKLLSVHMPELIEQLKLKFKHELSENQVQLDNLNKAIVRTEDELRKRFDKIRSDIDEERNQLFQSFVEETDKIRDQIHSLDYDTLSKKDELLRAVKEEASKIQGQIDSFEKIYDNARENIFKQVNEQEQELAVHLNRLQIAIRSSLETMDTESEKKRTEMELFLLESLKNSSDHVKTLEKIIDEKSTSLIETFKGNQEKLEDRTRKLENFIVRAMTQVEETAKEKREQFDEKISLFEAKINTSETEIEKRITKFERLIENSLKIIDDKTSQREEELLHFVDAEFNKVKTKIDYFHELFNENSGALTSRVREKEEQLLNVIEGYKKDARSAIDEIQTRSEYQKSQVIEFVTNQLVEAKNKFNSFEKAYESASIEFTQNARNTIQDIQTQADVQKTRLQELIAAQALDTKNKLSVFENTLASANSTISENAENAIYNIQNVSETQKAQIGDFISSQLLDLKNKYLTFEKSYEAAASQFAKNAQSVDEEIRQQFSEIESATETAIKTLFSETNERKNSVQQFFAEQFKDIESHFNELNRSFQENAGDLTENLSTQEEAMKRLSLNLNQFIDDYSSKLANEAEQQKESFQSFIESETYSLEKKLESFQNKYTESIRVFEESAENRDRKIETRLSHLEDVVESAVTLLGTETKKFQTQLLDFSEKELSRFDEKIIEFKQIFEENSNSVSGSIKIHENELNDLVKNFRLVVQQSVQQIIEETEEKKDELQTYSAEQFTKLQSRVELFNSIIEEGREIIQDSSRLAADEFGEKVSVLEESIQKSFAKVAVEAESEKNKLAGFIEIEVNKIQHKIQDFDNYFKKVEATLAKNADSREGNINEMMQSLKESIADSIEEIQQLSGAKQSDLHKYVQEQINFINENFASLTELYNSSLNKLESTTKESVEIIDLKKVEIDESLKVVQQQIGNSKSGIDKHIENEMSVIDEKFGSITELVTKSVNQLDKKTRESEEIIELKKISLEKSIQSAINEVFDESEARKIEFIESAEKELGNFQDKMASFQSVYNESIESMHEKSALAAKEVNELVQDLNAAIEGAMSKLENLSAEEMDGLQSQINKAITSVQKRAEEVFQESYEQFVSDVSEYKNEFKRVQDQINTLEKISNERFTQLSDNINNIKEKIEDELASYLQHVKKSAKEMTEVFEKDLSGKMSGISKDIENLEGEIAKLRNQSTEEIESKVSPLYTKLSNIELNLLDSQKHLMNKWNDETNQVMKKIHDKEILFIQSAEKWEAQFGNMEKTARESVHKGFVELEKKRSDLLESFDTTMQAKVAEIERLSENWSEENEKTLSELVSSFKLKMQEKEDAAFDKMQQMNQRFNEIKKEVQSKHDSVLELLQTEKSKLEKELKGLGEKQMQLFTMEMDSRIDKTTETMQANSEAMVAKMDKDISSLRSEFKDVEETTREMIANFTHEKKDLFAKIDKETKQTAKEIMSVQESFHRLKEEMKALDKAEKSTEKVRKTVQLLEDKLNQAESKTADIQEIYRRVDELKEVRLKLDSELMMLAQKREKVDKLEDQLQLILNLRDQIEEKGEHLETVKSRIEDIIGAQSHVDEYRTKLDGILEEFVSQHALVENVIETMTDHQKTVGVIGEKVQTLTSSIESIDDRSKGLKEQMITFEVKLEAIKRHENDIQDVKNKFLEIEDLIADIENRKKQIETLRKRFEELRMSMNDSVLSIEKIEHDAESKVQQLTDLINAAEYTEKIPGKGSEKTISKNIGSDKRNMIVRLGEMGWSADEIASKINMDLNSIETILSTSARQ